MEKAQALKLAKRINRGNICDPANLPILNALSLQDREDFALHSQTVTLYLGEEVDALMRAEEDAVLQAVPKGFSIESLNGVNIGCGDRIISPYIQQIDITRVGFKRATGGHDRFASGALLALPTALPFRESSIDFVVSLHCLEHLEDPVVAVLHWLNIVKPGGGVGVVVPDWRFTWDARNDASVYGHKWNPTPEVVRRLYEQYWSAHAALEQLATYPFRASFDFVLRKPGTFEPFRPPHESGLISGRELNCIGRMID